MDPNRFPKISQNVQAREDLQSWKVVCPPYGLDREHDRTHNNRAFFLYKFWGGMDLDDGRWVITSGWFEREDGIKVHPMYDGWEGSKTNPRPTHCGWYVTWREEKIGIVPVCGPYAVMKVVDKKWTHGKPVTGRMALLFGDLDPEELDETPEEIPPAKVRNPLSMSDRLEPIASVLRALAGQENCDGEPYDEMMAAADRLEWLEQEVARLRGER